MKFLLLLALLGCASLLCSQSESNFSDLSREETDGLDRQRALVAAVAKQR
jgi:hypothetical protein